MRLAIVAGLLIAVASLAQASLHFPVLTGRVVDEAHVLSPSTKQALEQQLATHEQATTNQIVVATVASLQGTTIEDYGYQLGRFWGIGQKGKNNGVVLIVAPSDRKVRIEVGYGLEGKLTDAVSSQIIQSVILPQFRQHQMERGIVEGVSAIETVLAGKQMDAARPNHSVSTHSNQGGGAVVLFVIVLAFFLFSQIVLFAYYIVGSILGFILSLFGFNGLSNYMQRQRKRFYPTERMFLLWLLTPSTNLGGSGSSWSSGSGGGGFSGGGGSFGGGGSSGGW